MMRYMLMAALATCLGLGSYLWWVMGRLDDTRWRIANLQADLDMAQARIDQAAQAAAVHRAYIDRLQLAQAEAAAAEKEAMTMEGADAPLPDYLRAILDRVQR